MKTDTIAAISTGMKNGGIGIIRVSGDEAVQIVDNIFKCKNKCLKNQETHTIHYGYIYDENEVVDEVLVMLMRGPRTFTAEDTVEINCHGGVVVMNKILETVIKHGARPAEPGEFTKRAFLNGRMDLSQAEAVMDIISAKNEYALKSSVSQLKGSVHNKIKEIRKEVIYHIAFIESALDDPEHISLDGYDTQLREVNDSWIEEIKVLIDSSKNGKIISEGIKTVIVGKPNAGKSSLLNALVGEERAIVTDIAGTTRDALEEPIEIHGISLNIMDTAGIRDTEDLVESIGVKKAKDYAMDADLIIYVVDGSTSLDENDREIIKMLKDRKSIILLNKTDLNTVTDEVLLKNMLPEKIIISISAKENTGIDQFGKALKEMFLKGEISFNDQVYITNIRHKNALMNAYESLSNVKKSIDMQMPEDFFSIDLMDAYQELGSIIGESVEEDLVNEIFSKFCMGK